MNTLLVTKSAHNFKALAVGQLLLYAGLVMMVTLPYFVANNLVPVDQYLAISLIILLSLLAGLYSQYQAAIIVANIVVSLIAIFVFEAVSITSFQSGQFEFFLVNILLTSLFYVALYINTKAFRTYFLTERKYLTEKTTRSFW